MNTSKLMLHCGGQIATREQVQAVATPAGTDTWCPVPHIELVNTVQTALGKAGMTVVTESFALAHEGNRFFGLMQVSLDSQPEAKDYGCVVSLRNGHDRAWRVLLGTGSSAFVCDNLAFSSEIQVARKHTSQVLINLPRLISNAVGQLAERWTDQDARIAKYKTHELTDGQANDLIVRAYEAGVAPITVIPDVIKEWHTPRHAEYKPRTAWSLFNAFTQVLTPRDEDSSRASLWALPRRTTALHGLMDSTVGILGREVKVDVSAN
jgi:hypothetical protein